MEKKNIHLTNEDLTGRFKSNFNLVNYAIKLAENMIQSGRDPRVKSDLQNRAMLVLEEICAGKDYLDIIPEKPVEEQPEPSLRQEAKSRFPSEEKSGKYSKVEKGGKYERLRHRVALEEMDG